MKRSDEYTLTQIVSRHGGIARRRKPWRNAQLERFYDVGIFINMSKSKTGKSMEYLPRIKGKSLFLFATHRAAAGSAHALKAMDHAKASAPNASIIGTYSCQGKVDPKFLETAKSKPQPPEWLADAAAAMGYPDEIDMEDLKRLVSEISDKVIRS